MGACKHLKVTEQRHDRWRKQYGVEWARQAGDAKWLRELQREKNRLKGIVADHVLDLRIPKDVNRGNL